MSRHTFAICAYGQSPYLRECIESTLDQTQSGSEVYIATSTPSEWLDGLATEYGLPVYVNHGERGIGQDWNFAVGCATGDYVTVAHQDDVYCRRYVEVACAMLDDDESAIVFFSNYGELRNGEPVDDNKLLSTKRRLLAGLADGRNAHSKRARRRAMSLGNAYCCPSATLNMRVVPSPPFHTGMKSNLDWDTWERLSRLDGGFYYSSEILMYHRIHEGSTTTSLIEDNTRSAEDYEMLCRFWPRPVAGLINRVYGMSEKSNKV